MSTYGQNSNPEAALAEARSLRAAYVGRILRAIGGWISARYTRFAQARANRAAVRALAELDVHTKRDVGLSTVGVGMVAPPAANENRPRDVA